VLTLCVQCRISTTQRYSITIMKYKHTWNYNHKKDTKREKVKGVSMTVKGESYTIAELMHRTANGLVDSVYKDGQYDEDVDFDSVDMHKVHSLDPVEQTEVLNTTLESEVNQAKQKAKDKSEKAAKERSSVEETPKQKNEPELEEETSSEEN